MDDANDKSVHNDHHNDRALDNQNNKHALDTHINALDDHNNASVLDDHNYSNNKSTDRLRLEKFAYKSLAVAMNNLGEPGNLPSPIDQEATFDFILDSSSPFRRSYGESIGLQMDASTPIRQTYGESSGLQMNVELSPIRGTKRALEPDAKLELELGNEEEEDENKENDPPCGQNGRTNIQTVGKVVDSIPNKKRKNSSISDLSENIQLLPIRGPKRALELGANMGMEHGNEQDDKKGNVSAFGRIAQPNVREIEKNCNNNIILGNHHAENEEYALPTGQNVQARIQAFDMGNDYSGSNNEYANDHHPIAHHLVLARVQANGIEMDNNRSENENGNDHPIVQHVPANNTDYNNNNFLLNNENINANFDLSADTESTENDVHCSDAPQNAPLAPQLPPIVHEISSDSSDHSSDIEATCIILQPVSDESRSSESDIEKVYRSSRRY